MRIFWKLAASLTLVFSMFSAAHAADAKPHRIAVQIDQNDPATMNLALNNVTNIVQYYRDKGETVDVAVVAYGPGLNMYRDDTSPVKDRLKQISEMAFPSNVKFAACGNTKENMEKKEGHSIALVPQASVVPSGVVTLSELQEQGWTYIRP